MSVIMADKKVKKVTKVTYDCEYCLKEYKTEKGLYNHLEKCVKKQRYDEKDTVGPRIGFMIYNIYCNGYKPGAKHVPTVYDFIKFEFYNKFVEFGVFVGTLPNTHKEKFVHFVFSERLRLGIYSFQWMYNFYIRNYLKREKPLEAFLRSVQYVQAECDRYKIDVSDFFVKSGPEYGVEVIYKGLVSPWMWLLSEGKARKYWISHFSTEDYAKLNNVIDFTEWATVLNEYKVERVEYIKVLKELGLY